MGAVQRVLVPGVLAGGLLPVASGTHSQPCEDWILYVPEDSETTTYPVYVSWPGAEYQYPGFWLPWIYAESNGMQGLQRDDDFCHNGPWDEDTRDTIIF